MKDIVKSRTARLILASASKTRRALLTAAGVAVEVIPADIDEAALRGDLLAEDDEIERPLISETLARAKATSVSDEYPDALVIGADQILAFNEFVLEKPGSVTEARACLMRLRGQKHRLHSSIALAEDGNVVWAHTATATLTMRNFSEAALDAYLEVAGDHVLTSVGAYEIEGPAIQLFESIEGDYTTILGLPLLPLLAELRARKALPE